MGIDEVELLEGIKKYAEYEKVKEVIRQINEAGWLGKIAKALSLVPIAIGMAEKAFMDLSDISSGGGKEKREAAINWIDEVVELPMILETLGLDRKFAGLAIDGMVAWLNFTKGKLWINTAKDFLGVE